MFGLPEETILFYDETMPGVNDGQFLIDAPEVNITGLTITTVSANLAIAIHDLGDNIKCGNSVISPDFYSTISHVKLDHFDRNRINPFNW